MGDIDDFFANIHVVPAVDKRSGLIVTPDNTPADFGALDDAINDYIEHVDDNDINSRYNHNLVRAVYDAAAAVLGADNDTSAVEFVHAPDDGDNHDWRPDNLRTLRDNVVDALARHYDNVDLDDLNFNDIGAAAHQLCAALIAATARNRL